MADLEFHPLADAFPLLDGEEFDSLTVSVRENDQREPIVLYEGKILDGRNRYRACRALGIEPLTREFDGSDPIAFVIDANIRRRHLNESQRAMAAAAIARLQQGERKSQGTDDKKEPNAQIQAFDQKEAARLLNVGRSSVQHARKVTDHGTPELQTAVKQGDISVSAASRIAEKPRHEQKRTVRDTVATKGKKKRRPRGARCPVSTEPEPRHALDLRRLEVAWEVACDSARDEFMRRIGLQNFDWRNHKRG